MATKQAKEQAELAKTELDKFNAALSGRVLRALGQPSNLLAVRVWRLWESRFRVNIFVGDDATTARLAHSFFVTVDGTGNIVSSSPALVRAYEPVDGHGSEQTPAGDLAAPVEGKEPPCATTL